MGLWDWLTGNRSDERVFELEATPRPVIPNDEPCYQVPSGSPLPRGRMYTGIPPTYPGIYRITEIDYDGPHYIGCTINLLQRYKEHKRNGLVDETKEFRYAKVKDEFVQFYKDNPQALMELLYKLEQAKIEKHQPRKNKHRGGNGKPPKREIHGAIIQDGGMNFAVVSVNQQTAYDHNAGIQAIQSLESVFGIPVVLVTTDAYGAPFYCGHIEIVDFMTHVDIQHIPWQKYRV